MLAKVIEKPTEFFGSDPIKVGQLEIEYPLRIN